MEFEQILKLIDAVSGSELAGFELEKEGIRLSMTTGRMAVSVQETDREEKGGNILRESREADGEAQNEKKQEMATDREERKAEADFRPDNIVSAPLVGIFYAAPSEDSEAYVKVGDPVKKGQVLGIIEAMKLMNEIESEYDGVVEEILVGNEQVVEYGQPLFRIR